MEADSEAIEAIESDLSQAAKSLARTIAAAERAPLDESDALARECEETLEECVGLMLALEAEARRQPPEYTARWNSKLRKYRQDLAGLRTKVDRVMGEQKQYSDRNGLLNQRQQPQLVGQYRRLEETSGRIDNARRIADESVEIGQTTLENLDSQRGQLEHARHKLDGTNMELGRARRTLRTMWIAALGNKVLLIIIILVLLLIMGIIIYMRWFH